MYQPRRRRTAAIAPVATWQPPATTTLHPSWLRPPAEMVRLSEEHELLRLDQHDFERIRHAPLSARVRVLGDLDEHLRVCERVAEPDAVGDFVVAEQFEGSAAIAEEFHDDVHAKGWKRKAFEKKMEGARKLAAEFVDRLRDMGAKEVSFNFGVSFILQGGAQITFDLEKVAEKVRKLKSEPKPTS